MYDNISLEAIQQPTLRKGLKNSEATDDKPTTGTLFFLDLIELFKRQVQSDIETYYSIAYFVDCPTKNQESRTQASSIRTTSSEFANYPLVVEGLSLLAYANKLVRGLQLSYPKQPRKKKGQPRELILKIVSPSINQQQFVSMSGSLVFLLDIVQYKCSNILYTCRQSRVNRHASRVIAIRIDKRTKRNSRNNVPTSVSSSYKTI